MALELELEHGKGTSVDESESVRLASLEVDGHSVSDVDTLVEVGDGGDVLSVLRGVHDGGGRDGLGTSWVEDAEEVLDQDVVLVVVPLREHDRVLLVPSYVGSVLLGVDDEGKSKTIGVLSWEASRRKGQCRGQDGCTGDGDVPRLWAWIQ